MGRSGTTVGLGALLLLAGCAGSGRPGAAPPTLYRRLGAGTVGGGRERLAMIVADFAANVAADGRIAWRFGGLTQAALERLKSNLADQLCEAAGGPCAYVGRDMGTAHRGLNVSETEWHATLEALRRALDGQGVGPRERDEILALLGPMKKDIVGR